MLEMGILSTSSFCESPLSSFESGDCRKLSHCAKGLSSGKFFRFSEAVHNFGR